MLPAVRPASGANCFRREEVACEVEAMVFIVILVAVAKVEKPKGSCTWGVVVLRVTSPSLGNCLAAVLRKNLLIRRTGTGGR